MAERDGVKLEQQVLITDDGIEVPSDYPWDGRLLDKPSFFEAGGLQHCLIARIVPSRSNLSTNINF